MAKLYFPIGKITDTNKKEGDANNVIPYFIFVWLASSPALLGKSQAEIIFVKTLSSHKVVIKLS
jgi:hypothetical protein